MRIFASIICMALSYMGLLLPLVVGSTDAAWYVQALAGLGALGIMFLLGIVVPQLLLRTKEA